MTATAHAVDIGEDDPVNEFVYFVANQASNIVKVGYSANLPKRLIDLQTSASCKLLLILHFRGDRATEREIHTHLNDQRQSGEWFSHGECTEALIDELSDFITSDDDGKEPWDHFVSAADVRRIVSLPGYGQDEAVADGTCGNNVDDRL